MRVLEIVSAQIADELTKGGTKIEMEPDRIIWPDGTVTKKTNPPKKGKKAPAPGSKHGVFGVIVAQYGGKNNAKNTQNPNQISIEPSQSPSQTNISTVTASSSQTPEKQKQTRRCN